jgi:hypothetical protein
VFLAVSSVALAVRSTALLPDRLWAALALNVPREAKARRDASAMVSERSCGLGVSGKSVGRSYLWPGLSESRPPWSRSPRNCFFGVGDRLLKLIPYVLTRPASVMFFSAAEGPRRASWLMASICACVSGLTLFTSASPMWMVSLRC